MFELKPGSWVRLDAVVGVWILATRAEIALHGQTSRILCTPLDAKHLLARLPIVTRLGAEIS